MLSKELSLEQIELQNQFIKRVSEIKKDIYGSEKFGNETEYYSDEGAVLFTSTSKNNDQSILFNFFDEAFEFEIEDNLNIKEISENISGFNDDKILM